MTIQSLAWAMSQNVPGTAGRVLIALGNWGSHVTGYVYFDPEEIAREACIPVASLWRYLGALERNGYLAKDDTGAGVEKRSYWLGFERDSAKPWSWSADEEAEDERTAPPPRATSDAPIAFRPAEASKARAAAAAPPPDQALGVPVIDGSDASRAWGRHYRDVLHKPPPFVHAITLRDGTPSRGFYMPSLYPPADDRIENLDGAA